jgi:hypothetical protein
MRDRRRGLGLASIVAAGGAVAMLLGACGSSSPTLDTTTVQQAIAASILSQRNVHTTVHCPSTVTRKTGVVFTCTARLDVGTYPVVVTEQDDKGHVRYANPAPLVVLDSARVERAIAQSILAQRHLHATVSCPAAVLQQAGLKFTCFATIAGRRYPFEVTQVNGHGQVSYVGR